MTLPKSQVLEMWPSKGHGRQLHSRGNWEKQVVTWDADPFSLPGPRPADPWEELRMLPAPNLPSPWSRRPQFAAASCLPSPSSGKLNAVCTGWCHPDSPAPKDYCKKHWWLRKKRLDSAGFKTTARAAQILTSGSGSPLVIPDVKGPGLEEIESGAQGQVSQQTRLQLG